ncbi:glutathione-dependent formaldehyde-activating enzyme [Coniella lustricola]|uniref:Glutathione-dependent formaldehyde-activating enzyme n=1 Tax=Coniella lustricola TaxID=2025994 RepID=A0A2T2ZYY3_9PEZI|nr:glutathione-dependent formaldehyde-activating enzyme [Coniella lustricola]
MADTKTYSGNCHCGRYRFTLEGIPDITSALACPCRLCSKKGHLWLVPPQDALRVIRDEVGLTSYQSATLKDEFCNHCGTAVLGEHQTGPLKGQLAVNVRAIQGLNPFQIDLEPPAQHVFSCHCGQVQAELLTSLAEHEIKEDNCSSCVRTAYIGTYPAKDQVRLYGTGETFEYRRPPGYSGRVHCKTCGVLVYTNVYGPPATVFDRLPPERKEKALAVYHQNLNLKPLNVRALEDVELESLVIVRSDEGTEGYRLEN